MKKKERGAITIEATLVLTMFMFAIVTILSVVDICLAQARISVAIDATAKEISQYSYLYGLTGLNSIKKTLKESGANTEDQINDTISGISDIFKAIQEMGETGKAADITDPSSVGNAWNNLKASGGKVKASTAQVKAVADTIKEDPKNFIFGIARLAASDVLDYGTSKLIAEPISRGMIEKHLKSRADQDAESYLKRLKVVPGEDGTYMSGLDFSESSLFMYGSDDIIIIVKYKVKIIPLLPIDMEYSFRQTAKTKGWLGGDYVGTKSQSEAAVERQFENNHTLWTDADAYNERGPYIRSLIMDEHNGYHQIKGGYTYTDAYNPTTKDFMIIGSSNLLYSEDTENPKKVSDITDLEIKECLDRYCDPFNAELEGISSVTYSENNVKVKDSLKNDYTKTLVLVIPEDEGLKERFEDYINKRYDSNGVNIQIVQKFGKGASAS